jgi:hypothetical protein
MREGVKIGVLLSVAHTPPDRAACVVIQTGIRPGELGGTSSIFAPACNRSRIVFARFQPAPPFVAARS